MQLTSSKAVDNSYTHTNKNNSVMYIRKLTVMMAVPLKCTILIETQNRMIDFGIPSIDLVSNKLLQ